MAQARTARMSELQQKAADIGRIGDEGLHDEECITCHERGWDVLNLLRCQGCKQVVCLNHKQPDSHACPSAARKETQSPSSGSRDARPKDVKCCFNTCHKKLSPSHQMIYKCKACDRVYCRDHLEKRDHVCKTLPPPPNKHTGKDAVSLFRANLKKKLGAFGSTKQSGGTATNPIVLDNDSTSKRNKGGPKPVPRAATDAGVERIVIHKKSVMGNLNLSKSQQCLLAVEAQVEPKEPEAKKDPDAHGIAEPFSATKKKVVKAYTMKASFKDDWVMGKVRDESLKLLGLEENKYTDSQEDQWGIMFQDKDRGRIIIPDEKLRDVTAECPGMTLIIKKGYLIKREDLKGH